MLRRMTLTNFKCWRELDVELAPITLFFGTNSSGKTAILQSLLMLKQTADNLNKNQHLYFGNGERSLVDLGSYRDLVFSHGIGNGIAMSLSWVKEGPILSKRTGAIWASDLEHHYDRGKSIDYEVEWRMDNGIYISELAYKTQTNDGQTNQVKVRRREDGSYVHVLPNLGSKWEQSTKSAPESCYGLPLDSDLSGGEYGREFLQLMRCLYYLGPLRVHPKRHYLWTGNRFGHFVEPDGSDTIQFLIGQTQDDARLLTEVARHLVKTGVADDFQVRSIDERQRLYEAVVTIGGIESALLDVGFGVSQVLPVITMLLSAPEGSIILLEQPELHLHPNAQAALADLMLNAAEERNIQLIIESHSEHILRRLQRRIAEVEAEFATPENIKMYFCQPGENGSTAQEVKVDDYGQIANWPENFMGDISGDLHEMSRAGFARLREDVASG